MGDLLFIGDNLTLVVGPGRSGRVKGGSGRVDQAECHPVHGGFIFPRERVKGHTCARSQQLLPRGVPNEHALCLEVALFIVCDEARELIDEYFIIYLPVAGGFALFDLASQRVNLESVLGERLLLLPDAPKEASVWCRSSLSPRVKGHHHDLSHLPEGDVIVVLDPLRFMEEAVVTIDFIDAFVLGA